MRSIWMGVAAALALTPCVASAQDGPRIVMRRPLQAAPAGTTAPTTRCGDPGQPSCVTQCDYVGAYWETGDWQGQCGTGVDATRMVRCMAVRRDGVREPKSDAFCLQDADAFNVTCGANPS